MLIKNSKVMTIANKPIAQGYNLFQCHGKSVDTGENATCGNQS